MDKRQMYRNINDLQEVVDELNNLLDAEVISPEAGDEMDELKAVTKRLQEALYAPGKEDS